MKTRILPALTFACLLIGLIASPPASAEDSEAWKTILATPQDLKDCPAGQATLEHGLLHVRSPNGILIPQPVPDGAIRARLHFRERTGFPQLRLRRNGNAEARNTDYYELILFIRQGQNSVKEGYVNVTTQGKGRRVGVVPLPEPFVLGSFVDLEFSMVADHLEVKANGKLVFEINDSTLSKGGYWGVAALDAWFSNIQVRLKSTDPRLVQLEQDYHAAIARDVTPAHQEAVRSLDAKYTAALDRAFTAATQAASLESAQALATEKKRVEDHGPLPADDNAAHDSLKPLRQTYRATLAQLETQRAQRLQPLRETHLQALLAYEQELTRAQQLDAALTVRKHREFQASLP